MRSNYYVGRFDTGLAAMQTLFNGMAAKAGSLTVLVAGGGQFSHGEPGARKNSSGVLT